MEIARGRKLTSHPTIVSVHSCCKLAHIIAIVFDRLTAEFFRKLKCFVIDNICTELPFSV